MYSLYVGAAYQIHWIGLCVSIVLVTLSIVMGATLALRYAIDYYKEIAGEVIVIVIMILNVMGKSIIQHLFSFVRKRTNLLRSRLRFRLRCHANGHHPRPSKILLSGCFARSNDVLKSNLSPTCIVL